MSNLIEIYSHDEKNFKILSEFEGWKYALMNELEKYRAENITVMQKHSLTDEIFVLLKGNCTLFVAEGDEAAGEITAVKMEPFKVYNIKKGVWHTHAFFPDTEVFIVENSNTCGDNSPFCQLTDEQIQFIINNA